ncbi:MAG TPA: DUF4159 domain-containing protein [Vicinamibacterales bacterium]|nr:DUF4159 domain-containing protein [Vicinamibacterales bacterium]
MTRKTATACALAGIALAVGATRLAAQRPFGGGFFGGGSYGDPDPKITNPDYNGQFTFARIKYTSGVGPGFGVGGYYYRNIPAWAHGYVPDPRRGSGRAEVNLMKIMDDVTYLDARVEDSVVYGFDDPGLFKYPVAYMTEPGFWTMNEKEAAGLRAYLLKGGFLIVDDFRHDGDRNQGAGWDNFEANVKRAFPDEKFFTLNPSLAIYDSFFRVQSFDIIPQAYDRNPPEFYGLFEGNDPKKRLMMIVNYSTDISDFWEFSSTGFMPIEESNEAYKLGVNYIMYGLTH